MNINNKRAFAFLIDLLFIVIISTLFSGFLEIEKELGTITIFDWNVTYGIDWSFLFYVVYFVLFDVFNNSITIGKELLKIKVVAINSEYFSLRSRINRTLLKMVSILFLPISALVFLINGKTLEDNYSNTKTVEDSYIITV